MGYEASVKQGENGDALRKTFLLQALHCRQNELIKKPKPEIKPSWDVGWLPRITAAAVTVGV